MTDTELTKMYEIFADNLQRWNALPIKDKIIALVAAIRGSEPVVTTKNIIEKLRLSARYPFTDDNTLCAEEVAAGLNGVCIHSGRVKLSNEKIVEWQIWDRRREHTVEIICR